MNHTDVAANTVLAGASGFLVAAFGLDTQTVLWALTGSVLGVTLAPPASRIYAMFLFVAATLACALGATAISAAYFANNALSRNICAVVLAALFHPIFKSLIGRVPVMIEAWTARISAILGGSK